MKVKTLPLLAGAAGMLAVTGFANAAISGLYVESVASNTLTNTTLVGTTYRIYVQFDNPDDRFLSAAFGDLDFFGSLYQDAAFGTNLGPHSAALDPVIANLAADSYLAVNAGTPSGDPDYEATGAAQFAAGTGVEGGWFLSNPDSPQNAPDANGRVLVMFLTFEGAGLPDVDGIITSPDGQTPGGLQKYTSTALADLILGQITFSYSPAGGGDVTAAVFNFDVPAPGALALLGVAGLVGKRRRRS